MKKRRLTEEFKSMGMRYKKDDLVLITEDSFLIMYTDDDSLKTICIEIAFKERHMTKHEIDTYKKMFIEKSTEDNLF